MHLYGQKGIPSVLCGRGQKIKSDKSYDAIHIKKDRMIMTHTTFVDNKNVNVSRFDVILSLWCHLSTNIIMRYGTQNFLIRSLSSSIIVKDGFFFEEKKE
mmetsp:Transcript_1071/g.1371  ORF Transcript_1071/g.1371 Transcript_1071/m.1371 type:complete len:100 (-) Transcript_1071:1047-1346(-)